MLPFLAGVRSRTEFLLPHSCKRRRLLLRDRFACPARLLQIRMKHFVSHSLRQKPSRFCDARFQKILAKFGLKINCQINRENLCNEHGLAGIQSDKGGEELWRPWNRYYHARLRRFRLAPKLLQTRTASQLLLMCVRVCLESLTACSEVQRK